jgi:uncharacterized membrane protein YkgB
MVVAVAALVALAMAWVLAFGQELPLILRLSTLSCLLWWPLGGTARPPAGLDTTHLLLLYDS